jgi:hypothetical protein
MSPLKALIRLFPGGKALTDRLSIRRRQRKLERIGDAEARFTHIYDANAWKDEESRSGAGSSMRTTRELRAVLPGLVGEFRVGRLLDAPCGDYHWFRHVERDPPFEYIGGDIVQKLIDANTSAYGSEDTSFLHLDITQDELPAADLWMCRDCMIHLSYDMTEQALRNFAGSGIEYLLATTHRKVTGNIDIPTGHCRMINLELPPYNLPPPERYVPDDDFEDTGKCLGLWRRSQIAAALG